MNQPDWNPSLFAILGATALAALVLGFFIGRRRSGAPASPAEPEKVEIESKNDEDDPTAPIVPMVEMSKSPHDRHRDLVIGKAIVKRIDFLDAMIKSSEKKGDEDMSGQLEILRRDFIDLLGECSVEAFEYPAGTVVDSEIRRCIQVVGGSSSGERTVIAETVLCGFRYEHGDEDNMILRKAEVTIG